MVIESIELENFRNYSKLHMEFDKEQIYYTEIMHKEKPIFWKQYMYPAQANLKKQQRQRDDSFWYGRKSYQNDSSKKGYSISHRYASKEKIGPKELR